MPTINNNVSINWLQERLYLIRHISSGIINTVVGFIVIYLTMRLGFSPVIANIAGYGVGFILGFVLSKKFVFRSNGHFVAESIRYLIAFFISFLFNLLILRFTLNIADINVMLAQAIATGGYTVLMYLLTRLFVFHQYFAMPAIFNLITEKHLTAITFLFLIVFSNLFVIYYITQEQYIYYWDWAGYWKIFNRLNTLFLQSPLDALRFLKNSIRHDDYNPLPVLPLMPVAWLFGTSRLTYILAVTNLLLLPSVFMMAFFTRSILVQHFSKPALPLIIAVVSIFTLHPLWLPVLRGFPDIIGLGVIGIILLRLFKQAFNQQPIKYLIQTGLFLCLLVLLRRWYTFWVVAFFPALVISQSIYSYQQYGLIGKYYIQLIKNTVIIGLSFSLALFIIATPFMIRAISTNYADIYSAYRAGSSIIEISVTLPFYFGGLTITLALIGLIWLIFNKNTRTIGIFLLTHLIIVFCLFSRTQNFGFQHYYLLMLSISVGIATLLINLWINIRNNVTKISLVGLTVTLLFIQFSYIFIPGTAHILNTSNRFIAQNIQYPFIRKDMEVISDLWNKLDDLQSEQDGSIYVLASSGILNEEILRGACQFDVKKRNFCHRVLPTSHVDKIYVFPRQLLTDATYLIVTTPVQYHLNPEGQRVIGMPAEKILAGDGIGTSYQRIPDEFTLDNEVKVRIYKKVKPINKDDMNALMNDFFAYYPQLKKID
jgi:putative flippase GtrA